MLQRYLALVKFPHTVFALPFALVGLALGFRDAHQVSVYKLIYVLLCMVFARSAAMAFNRYVDRALDARNARTAGRELPAGLITPAQALGFVIFNCIAFIACTYWINPLCFALSPVALAVVLGYSYTKRFTPLCHLILGLGLGLAPVGAYLAVTEHFTLPIILLGTSVLTWTGGFDIVYALQDEEFDRAQRLNSIPAWLGTRTAIGISIGLHLITACCMVAFGLLTGGHWLFWLGATAFVSLLVYQHLLVRPGDLTRINAAFFTANGIGSLVFGTLALLDLTLA